MRFEIPEDENIEERRTGSAHSFEARSSALDPSAFPRTRSGPSYKSFEIDDGKFQQKLLKRGFSTFQLHRSVRLRMIEIVYPSRLRKLAGTISE